MINRHLKNIKPTFSNFKRLAELWPIVIIWPTILGYLAFNIYASKYGITYPDVEIHLIVGLGIFNLFAIILTYYSGITTSRYRSLNSLKVTFYIYFFALQPVLILSVLYLDIIYKAFSRLKAKENKKISFARLRKIASKQYLYTSLSDLAVYIIILSITIFINADIILVWGFFFFSTEVIHYIKNNFSRHIYYLGLITLLTPFVTTLYVLDDAQHTFFGISNHIVEIKTDEESIKGQMNYQSADFIFLSNDSTNIKIPISKVESITQIDEFRKPDNYYEKFKEWFSED